MKKLIEVHQENALVCDNTKCEFTIKNEQGVIKDMKSFINKPCPKCGENLLTEQDYLMNQRFINMINWVNKWFSWIGVFHSKKSSKSELRVHCHDGIKIKNKSS